MIDIIYVLFVLAFSTASSYMISRVLSKLGFGTSLELKGSIRYVEMDDGFYGNSYNDIMLHKYTHELKSIDGRKVKKEHANYYLYFSGKNKVIFFIKKTKDEKRIKNTIKDYDFRNGRKINCTCTHFEFHLVNSKEFLNLDNRIQNLRMIDSIMGS